MKQAKPRKKSTATGKHPLKVDAEGRDHRGGYMTGPKDDPAEEKRIREEIDATQVPPKKKGPDH